jgi:DDE family transposase
LLLAATLSSAISRTGVYSRCFRLEAVGHLLHALGYRLQALRKTQEGTSHLDRNAQFEHINTTAAAFLQRQQPVISVDTNYDPAPIMDTVFGAGGSPPRAGRPTAAHLIRRLYT